MLLVTRQRCVPRLHILPPRFPLACRAFASSASHSRDANFEDVSGANDAQAKALLDDLIKEVPRSLAMRMSAMLGKDFAAPDKDVLVPLHLLSTWHTLASTGLDRRALVESGQLLERFIYVQPYHDGGPPRNVEKMKMLSRHLLDQARHYGDDTHWCRQCAADKEGRVWGGEARSEKGPAAGLRWLFRLAVERAWDTAHAIKEAAVQAVRRELAQQVHTLAKMHPVLAAHQFSSDLWLHRWREAYGGWPPRGTNAPATELFTRRVFDDDYRAKLTERNLSLPTALTAEEECMVMGDLLVTSPEWAHAEARLWGAARPTALGQAAGANANDDDHQISDWERSFRSLSLLERSLAWTAEVLKARRAGCTTHDHEYGFLIPTRLSRAAAEEVFSVTAAVPRPLRVLGPPESAQTKTHQACHMADPWNLDFERVLWEPARMPCSNASCPCHQETPKEGESSAFYHTSINFQQGLWIANSTGGYY